MDARIFAALKSKGLITLPFLKAESVKDFDELITKGYVKGWRVREYYNRLVKELGVKLDPVVEETAKDEKPVVEETAKDEKPVVEETTKDEKPVVEETAKDEEPVVEETAKDEEPVVEEEKSTTKSKTSKK